MDKHDVGGAYRQITLRDVSELAHVEPVSDGGVRLMWGTDYDPADPLRFVPAPPIQQKPTRITCSGVRRGRAPRLRTNTRRRGSRRVTATRAGPSDGEPGEPDPPPWARRWRRCDGRDFRAGVAA